MPADVVLADVSRSVVAGTNLAGLVLGVFGALFFAYDLLGRPGGPLRWFLRISLPTLLGAAAFFLAGAMVQYVSSPDAPDLILRSGLGSATVGAILGTLNGALIEPPKPGARRHVFSLRGLVVGALIGGIYVLVLGLVVIKYFDAEPDDVLVVLLPVAMAVGLAGGVWNFVNVGGTGERYKPRFFSFGGFLAGSAIGVAVVFVVVFGEVLLLVMRHSEIFLSWRDVAVIGLGFGLATGLVGGLTRFFFWRVNSLRPRGLEVMGIWCILLAFVAQAIDPVLTVLGVEVR